MLKSESKEKYKSLQRCQWGRFKSEKEEVDRILDHKIENDQISYLVKWDGLPDHKATWKPFKFFSKEQPDFMEKYLLEYFDKQGELVSLFSDVHIYTKGTKQILLGQWKTQNIRIVDKDN